MTPEDEEFARIEAEINRRQPVPVKTYHDGKPWPVQPKPWVGLTDEEIQTAWDEVMDGAVFTRREVYKAIEAKLKEKNI
jgi:hypothetical protein